MSDDEAAAIVSAKFGAVAMVPEVFADLVFENTGRTDLWFLVQRGLVDLTTDRKVIAK